MSGFSLCASKFSRRVGGRQHVSSVVSRYGFVQMGKLKLKDSQSKITIGDGKTAYGEFDDLSLFAGGIQTLFGDGYFRYGYEAEP